MPVGDNTVSGVYNHDVVFLADNITRFVVEAWKSSSSGTSGISEFDKTRLNSYLDALDAAHDHVLGQPGLDLPETHPSEWPIEPFPVDLPTTDVESEEVNHIIRMFGVCWDELVHSQSARVGSGLNEFDSARLRSYVEKARKFLSDYVSNTAPLDVPESSPKEKHSGSGARGVNPTTGR
jgi:hypothetical protein